MNTGRTMTSSAIACSVIGAAHCRRGKPCQDASLARELRGRRGERLLLLAVADGHGGSRYWLSGEGSRLACEQAAAAVAAALADHDLADLERWQQLLADELPATIQRRWLEAVEADWRQRTEQGTAQGTEQHPELAGQLFSPLTYGSTLGLALLSPGWWGHTGLGDWDLVQLNGSEAALVSEEAEQGGPAEATASLCLADAAGRWRGRAALVPLTEATPPFCLLLSSDGVRKSCATDADFLSLCAHLAELADPAALAEGLAQITAAGSGDDVSVAIGRWGHHDAPTNSPAAPGPPAATSRARLAPLLIAAAALLALGGLAAGLALGWGPLRSRQAQRPGASPASGPATTPTAGLGSAARASLERESRRLCQQPQLIQASLAQRQAQFGDLLGGALQAPALIAAAARDPLGALIAASFQPAATTTATTEAPAPAPLTPGQELLGGSCVELRQALEQQWRLQRQAGRRMPPAPQPATAPPSRP